jgi:hypothetical protein
MVPAGCVVPPGASNLVEPASYQREPQQEGGAVSDPRGEPHVEFVPEMAEFAESLGSPPPVLPAREREDFEAKWEAAQPVVARGVTPEALVGISRWAREETRSFHLDSGWLAHLPMNPMRADASGTVVILGQEPGDGVPLPSHNSLVFRRLVVCVEYDRGAGAIRRVYVTIRGWAEE